MLHFIIIFNNEKPQIYLHSVMCYIATVKMICYNRYAWKLYDEPEKYMNMILLANQNGCSINSPVRFYPFYDYPLSTRKER